MPAIVIIPSRYASTRFPGKPLYPLLGKPMIQHVYERVKQAVLVQDVFVATDNKLIYDTVNCFGGRAIMTSEKHISGTDRIAEAVVRLREAGYKIKDTDIIVNVQGDEPLVHQNMVDEVISAMDDKRASIGTLAKRIMDIRDILDSNVVKVVFDKEGFALYFSRSPIPFHRDIFQMAEEIETQKSQATKQTADRKISISCPTPISLCYKHIGIYAYRTDELLKLSELSPTRLEQIEKLEQLRALENGFKIKVRETEFETIGVDTPTDAERVEKCLSISS